jgi:hypothetical protein
MTQLTALWRRIPKPIRAGWIATGLLPELATAISSRQFGPFYNSLNIAATAALSAVTAFLAGCVNAIYRWAKPIEESYRTSPPDGGDRGQATVGAILMIACVVLAVMFIVTLID